jgi:hypothetical protein
MNGVVYSGWNVARARSSMLLSLTGVLLAVACSSSSPPTTAVDTRPLYERCGSNSVCVAGTTCTKVGPDNFCAQPCGAECPAGGTCGVADDGSAVCFPTCSRSIGKAYVCDAGRTVACVAAPESECETCPCAADKRCEPGVGCKEKLGLAKACRTNNDCESGNCSQVAKVCHVGVGQPCTDTNCDKCTRSVKDPGATRICESACGGTLSSECPDRSDCYGFSGVGGSCRRACDTRGGGDPCPNGFTCKPGGISYDPNRGYCSDTQ